MTTTTDDLLELAADLAVLRSAVLRHSTAALTDGERAPEYLHEVCQAIVDAATALARAREILLLLSAEEQKKSADILQFRRGPSDAMH